jgi:glycerate 2-kinase
MRILIAPDCFKESLSASAAGEIIAQACEQVAHSNGKKIECDVAAFSDGGEGLLEALAGQYDCQNFQENVQGPSGASVEAHWSLLRDDPDWLATNPLLALGKALLGSLFMPDLLEGSSVDHRKIAVIESAQAAGFHLVPGRTRNPMKLSSYGVGELIRKASQRGAGRIWIGLGGSATVDGGLGALFALGARFFDSDGHRVPANSNRPVARDLLDVHTVDLAGIDPRLRDTRVDLLCDVDNPLLGPKGAADVFGPQKGASIEQIRLLEEGLSCFAAAFARCGVTADPASAHMGAAGGMAFGLCAGLGGVAQSGASFLIDLLGMHERIANADLLITGEGCLDTTSFNGKAPGMLTSMAHDAGVPALMLVGHATPEGRQLADGLGASVRTITGDGIPREESLRDAAIHLRQAALAALDAFI